MEETKGHRKLIVWQRSMDLVVFVYRATASFPKEEIYGITSQMRRAAVSVPSNIAEGHGVGGGGFGRHLNIANGSLMELQTQMEICQRLGFLDEVSFSSVMEQIDSVIKPLTGLRKSVRGPES